MREIPKKITVKVPCYQCDETGDSPYEDINGIITACELCRGNGWFPEVLTLDKDQYCRVSSDGRAPHL